MPPRAPFSPAIPLRSGGSKHHSQSSFTPPRDKAKCVHGPLTGRGNLRLTSSSRARTRPDPLAPGPLPPAKGVPPAAMRPLTTLSQVYVPDFSSPIPCQAKFPAIPLYPFTHSLQTAFPATVYAAVNPNSGVRRSRAATRQTRPRPSHPSRAKPRQTWRWATPPPLADRFPTNPALVDVSNQSHALC